MRPAIRALYDQPYAAPTAEGPIRLLITGGSQGARLLSELVPEAVVALPEPLRRQLEREYGVDEVHGAGLRVYTTLDLDLQGSAERALENVPMLAA